MNKTLVVFISLLLFAVKGYGQSVDADSMDDNANNDSIVIFTFKANSDMFFVPYQNNDLELKRLLKIVKQYNVEIKSGQLPVFVSGYCFNSMRKERNMTLARTWSNRVKSELIVRRKLKEEHFITRNYAKPYNDLNYAVVVMLKFPREIIKEMFPEEEEIPDDEPSLPEPIVIKDVSVDESTGETTEIEVTIPTKEGKGSTKKKEKEKKKAEKKTLKKRKFNKKPATFSAHTNLLYWAIGTPNIGGEWRFDKEQQWGLLLNGAWTHWEWKDKTRKYRMWMVSPEIRHYLGDRWFVGGELHFGEMNIKLSDVGRQGIYYGLGAIGGYRLPISTCFDLDFTLGLGYTRFNKDNYEITEDGLHITTRKNAYRNLWGPTQAGIILRYKFK